ncbi:MULTISPECIES: esterase/lipase family protein [Hydrocarboniphaga]|uniref:PGAP1 family protein n=1 Tax=Hydrocarboniphaga effusa AP103 TaxID=1172194 RepID=I8I6A6_9GAMM|nr:MULTISPECIES: PGAP1 family protein [Hydrocarboniphaga]EIT72231.1 PGAP1 family protein [Hydrocarboniphaga effusa AP103]MDZ4079635.1 hypothetical protein [Hydrocarboniphaga sp.]
MRSSDLRGATRLAVGATLAITDIVEHMHRNISQVPWIFGTLPPGRTRGITGLVYRNVRRVTGWVGSGLDLAIRQLQPLIDTAAEEAGPAGRDAVIAVLNGVLGDHLEASTNPLATRLSFRRGGRELPRCEGGRVLLLIHGLCMHDGQWRRNGHDHGAALADEFGYTPIYLRYNSGRHVSTNGRELAEKLEALVGSAETPVTELAILGFSMGGLLARSACHYAALAGHCWPSLLKHLVFLGTPHLGAPLERGGNGLQGLIGMSPYSAPLAALGKLRSAGITDLRHGSLVDEDWSGLDRFERAERLPTAIGLPPGALVSALAGTTGSRVGDFGDRLFGDGLVPVESALGRDPSGHRDLPIAADRQWIGTGIGHLDLLDRREAYEALRRQFQ